MSWGEEGGCFDGGLGRGDFGGGVFEDGGHFGYFFFFSLLLVVSVLVLVLVLGVLPVVFCSSIVDGQNPGKEDLCIQRFILS